MIPELAKQATAAERPIDDHGDATVDCGWQESLRGATLIERIAQLHEIEIVRVHEPFHLGRVAVA